MPRQSGTKPARRSSRSARGRASSSKADRAAADAALAARRSARCLYTARDVERALERMAAELAPRLAEANPVVLAVMDGGAYAALELCRRFGFPHEFDYVHVTRYGRGTQGGRLRWRVRPRAALAGRVVLLVDDILDRGETLRALKAELRRVGVARLHTAVLVAKRVPGGRRRPTVDVAGLEVDDVFVFGSGMDIGGYWRALPGIFALEAPPHE